MFLQNSFGKTLDILQREMDVTSLRRAVIANNIANADTPNFKRSTINYEAQLGRALASEKAARPELALTNPKDIPANRPMDYRDVMPVKQLDYLTTSDNNGNNVDLEQESMLMLQNQLNYEMLSRIVSNQFAQINIVLK